MRFGEIKECIEKYKRLSEQRCSQEIGRLAAECLWPDKRWWFVACWHAVQDARQDNDSFAKSVALAQECFKCLWPSQDSEAAVCLDLLQEMAQYPATETLPAKSLYCIANKHNLSAALVKDQYYEIRHTPVRAGTNDAPQPEIKLVGTSYTGLWQPALRAVVTPVLLVWKVSDGNAMTDTGMDAKARHGNGLDKQSGIVLWLKLETVAKGTQEVYRAPASAFALLDSAFENAIKQQAQAAAQCIIDWPKDLDIRWYLSLCSPEQLKRFQSTRRLSLTGSSLSGAFAVGIINLLATRKKGAPALRLDLQHVVIAAEVLANGSFRRVGGMPEKLGDDLQTQISGGHVQSLVCCGGNREEVLEKLKKFAFQTKQMSEDGEILSSETSPKFHVLVADSLESALRLLERDNNQRNRARIQRKLAALTRNPAVLVTFIALLALLATWLVQKPNIAPVRPTDARTYHDKHMKNFLECTQQVFRIVGTSNELKYVPLLRLLGIHIERIAITPEAVTNEASQIDLSPEEQAALQDRNLLSRTNDWNSDRFPLARLRDSVKLRWADYLGCEANRITVAAEPAEADLTSTGYRIVTDSVVLDNRNWRPMVCKPTDRVSQEKEIHRHPVEPAFLTRRTRLQLEPFSKPSQFICFEVTSSGYGIIPMGQDTNVDLFVVKLNQSQARDGLALSVFIKRYTKGVTSTNFDIQAIYYNSWQDHTLRQTNVEWWGMREPFRAEKIPANYAIALPIGYTDLAKMDFEERDQNGRWIKVPPGETESRLYPVKNGSWFIWFHEPSAKTKAEFRLSGVWTNDVPIVP